MKLRRRLAALLLLTVTVSAGAACSGGSGICVNPKGPGGICVPK